MVDFEIKQFQYFTKHGASFCRYTARCPKCKKRTRLFWLVGDYRFVCRRCDIDYGGQSLFIGQRVAIQNHAQPTTERCPAPF